MNNIIDLNIIIPASFKKQEMLSLELQILVDGVVAKTVNTVDSRMEVCGLEISDTTTITLELRGIYNSSNMSSPVVHEFSIVNNAAVPHSDFFDIKIRNSNAS